MHIGFKLVTPTDIRDKAIRTAEKALRGMGEDIEDLRPLIEQYGDAHFDAATLRGHWQLDGCPAHAVGSRGQLSVHPLVIALREAEDHTYSLARALNLTPEARARRRTGAPMGSSTAPDRNPRLRVA